VGELEWANHVTRLSISDITSQLVANWSETQFRVLQSSWWCGKQD